MICISIGKASQLEPVLKEGAGLIELRLDLIREHPSALFAKIHQDIRTVVTCREGGYSMQERMDLLKRAIELGASFVDLELESNPGYSDSIVQVAAKHGCEVIFSHHDFKKTPPEEELIRILEACFDRGGAVAKIATLVRTNNDAVNLLSLYKQPGRKVVLGMGDKGKITRVAAPLLGSEFTFAAPAAEEVTAPGQMNAAELNAIYKLIEGS